MVEAADAGDDGRQKIATIAKDLEKWTLYDIASLSAALNRENTVYLAVKSSPISKLVRLALRRYQTFLNE